MSDEIECVTKQWGGSIGIVIPKEVVEQENIRPNQRIRVVVKKIIQTKDLWELGPIKLIKSAQEIKDELRKGW